ncbi:MULTISPECIES: hypothetical protein [Dietzia]|jgi:hypothetical protein|uniref:Uncharacterized protein n=1 Tax=Dietzia maris TaxID=37915 RepID=A0ABT8H425_9ACTN|nr:MULTISPECIES: hypothetical protein [Dietzia]MBB0995482.1 hypothetical protein [Dietzia sp. SLG510A3-40A3]MBB1010389.1 hypothetical protein [Dietzia sp. SLG510A3-3B2-2]MCZ4541840.1 hypothetical protein [Dietzia maris]MCZ4657693.1 hypothetical protein [Dietzia kunjamensis]MDN4507210.1 hypothetical protein [Dietzia maris]
MTIAKKAAAGLAAAGMAPIQGGGTTGWCGARPVVGVVAVRRPGAR